VGRWSRWSRKDQKSEDTLTFSPGDDWLPGVEGEGDGSGQFLPDYSEGMEKEGGLEGEEGLRGPSSEAKWFEKMTVRGYSQFRYNRIAETNPDVRSPQGDRSIGAGNSFFLRRARMIFSGDAVELLRGEN
jgi:hypothetical protein